MAGQPTKLHQKITMDDGRETTVDEEILRLASGGARAGTIADLIGLHRKTLYNWLHWGDPEWVPGEHDQVPKNRKPYMGFFARYTRATAVPTTIAQTAWLRCARDGDWRAGQAWLKAHRPDEYPDTINVRHGGELSLGGAVVDALTEYAQVFDQLTTDDPPPKEAGSGADH